MRRVRTAAAGLAGAAFLLSTACSTPLCEEAAESAPPPPTEAADGAGPLAAAKAMLPGVLEGLNKGDYALYSRDFTEEHREFFDKARFDKAREGVEKAYGLPIGQPVLLGDWEQRGVHYVQWKARCPKTQDDVLLIMYLVRKDSAYQIYAFKIR